MGIITIYALFGDDVRTLVTNSSGDPVFWYLNCVCLGAFSVEIIATSICKVSLFGDFIRKQSLKKIRSMQFHKFYLGFFGESR